MNETTTVNQDSTHADTAHLNGASPNGTNGTTQDAAQAAAIQEFYIQMLAGFWGSRTLHVAASLGLADLVLDGPKTSEEMAQATNTHAPSLYRVLRALAGMGVFVEDESGRFAATPLSGALLTGVPGSMRSMLISVLGSEHYDAWGDILHSVRTGEVAFDHVFGMPVWEFFEKDPESARHFNDSMTSMTEMLDPAILGFYDFSSIHKLVDVGGGHGRLLTAILSQNPHMQGVVFDQPHVVDGARERIKSAGLVDRCELSGGDFFQAVPEGGDAYLMKWIIHDWNDERALAILRNCHRAMNENGKLLLAETVLPGRNEPSLGKFGDLNMMVMVGGRERTEEEFRALFEASGFRLTRVIPTPAPISIIEGVRV